jgi:hypothetical protein
MKISEYIYLRLGNKDFLQKYNQYKHLENARFDWTSPKGSELCLHGRKLEFSVAGKWSALEPEDAKKLCDESPKRHVTLPVTQNLSPYAYVQLRNIKLRILIPKEEMK